MWEEFFEKVSHTEASEHLVLCAGAANPYTEANYKPSFLSDDELKHLILRVSEKPRPRNVKLAAQVNPLETEVLQTFHPEFSVFINAGC